MALSVVGAGFGRTATLSLKYALEQLGLGPCYHMREVFEHPEFMKFWGAAARGEPVDWDEVFEGYVSAVDWPACSYWRELAEHFPESKVLLSVRDPHRWYESASTTILSPQNRERLESAPPNADIGDMMRRILVGHFGGRFEDRDHAIGVFERHIETVKREIPPERLLVYEASQGWEPLCAFLGVPVPDAPFPRVNTREEFAERWRQREAEPSRP